MNFTFDMLNDNWLKQNILPSQRVFHEISQLFAKVISLKTVINRTTIFLKSIKSINGDDSQNDYLQLVNQLLKSYSKMIIIIPSDFE